MGLDDTPRGGGVRRSDSIILYGARLDGSGTTMISIPRDARVRFPGYRRHDKINAAYAIGEIDLLKETLAASSIMEADLPYYVVFGSETVQAVVDALGGIEVDVPQDMNYDDHWGNLSINLKAGRQLLNGKQAVGYLRWRKNNRGLRGNSDDFSRMERQREFLSAVKMRLLSWQGVLRLPVVYHAFRTTTQVNLSWRQMLVLGWAARTMEADAVPGRSRPRRGISYVECDWDQGRRQWQHAIAQ